MYCGTGTARRAKRRNTGPKQRKERKFLFPNVLQGKYLSVLSELMKRTTYTRPSAVPALPARRVWYAGLPQRPGAEIGLELSTLPGQGEGTDLYSAESRREGEGTCDLSPSGGLRLDAVDARFARVLP